MIRSQRLFSWCLTLGAMCALLVSAGCGGSDDTVDGQKLYPVTGTIKIGAKKLTRGTVSFRADTNRGNNSTLEPYGEVAEDGTYTLFTNKKKGAPLGKYVVLVEASEPIDPAKPSATPKAIVHRKYSYPEKPILQVDVVESPTPEQYDLQVD